MSKSLRQAVVVHLPPKAKKGRIIAAFTTVRRAEAFIAEREKTDPQGVYRGDYGIDASERADAEYRRLRRRS